MKRTNEGVVMATRDANGISRRCRVRLASECATRAVIDNVDYGGDQAEISRFWATAFEAAPERRFAITAGLIDSDLGHAYSTITTTGTPDVIEINPERGIDRSIESASVYEVAHV